MQSRYHWVRPRMLEWEHTAVLAWIGLVLLHPYPHLSMPSLSQGIMGVMPEPMWAVVLLAAALARAGALLVNGRAPRGSPLARILCAMLGMTLFLWLALGFFHAAPIGMWAGGVYAVMVASELVVIFRASCDLRRAYDAGA